MKLVTKPVNFSFITNFILTRRSPVLLTTFSPIQDSARYSVLKHDTNPLKVMSCLNAFYISSFITLHRNCIYGVPCFDLDNINPQLFPLQICQSRKTIHDLEAKAISFPNVTKMEIVPPSTVISCLNSFSKFLYSQFLTISGIHSLKFTIYPDFYFINIFNCINLPRDNCFAR